MATTLPEILLFAHELLTKGWNIFRFFVIFIFLWQQAISAALIMQRIPDRSWC